MELALGNKNKHKIKCPVCPSTIMELSVSDFVLGLVVALEEQYLQLVV